MKITPIITILLSLAFAGYSTAQTIRIAKLENTPDHILGGMLLEAIYKKANTPLKLVVIPSARALIQSSRGKVDGELQRIYALADSYPTLLRVPTPFTFFEPAAFTKNKLINIDGWASLQGYKVGMVRGMKFAEIGLKGNTNIHTVTGSHQLFTMLKLGRIDIAISARFNGLYQRSKLKLNSIQLLEPALDRHDLYHYLHMRHQKLVPIIDATIQAMVKNGELQRLRKQFYKEILK
ncbi:MAG: transporter substrate-binding domain-containing protein [Bermanella sp.]